jgi:predicted MFS family arabinose efflux permease
VNKPRASAAAAVDDVLPAVPLPPATLLRRNRDFNLLWVGQAVSSLGSQMSAVALPLLVLALTGSAADAGLAGFGQMLPLPLFGLAAGVLIDRWDRRRIMVAADSIRFVATGSLPAALWLDHLGLAQILIVAFLSGTCWVFFWVSENTALAAVVPEEQLASAVALNQARQYGSSLAGTPLGGFLFGLNRALPFVANALSYLASLITLFLIRTPLKGDPTPRRHPLVEAKEGLIWLWRQPFLRATLLLTTGSDFVLNAFFLILVVTAKREGASSTTVGVMFAIVGANGIVGSLLAPRLANRLSLRTVVIGVECLSAALVPLLLLASNAYLLGLIFGAALAPWPLWNASIGAYRLTATPQALQGRVQSISLLLMNGPVPLATLLAGVLLDAYGSNITIAVFSIILAFVAAAAVATPAVRRSPSRDRTAVS